MEKFCKHCQSTKPILDFGKNKTSKDGFDFICRSCKKAKNDIYRANRTPEQITAANARAKKFRDENPESVAGYREKAKPIKAEKARTKYREDTEYREKQKANAKTYRLENPEKVKLANAAWRADNLDIARKYARDYVKYRRDTDPEFHERTLADKTRWRLKNWQKDDQSSGWIRGRGRGEELPPNLLPRLHAWQEDHCYFCNKPLDREVLGSHPDGDTVEHILPRKRKGPTIPQNLVLCCGNCNSSRQEKIFHLEWKPKEIRIVSDRLTCQYASIAKALGKTGLGGRLDHEVGGYVLESGFRDPRYLFIVSTFWGSERNPGSHKGRYIEVLQKAYPNSIILLDREWYERNTAVINLLKSKMGIADKSLGARSLSVVNLSHRDSSKFLDEFHLMGKVISKYRFGLIADDGTLYGVGLFDAAENSYDCKRLAFRGHVPGGMSKIMKYARGVFGGAQISSFVDSRYASGAGHETIGFTHIGRTESVYYWVLPDKMRHYRYLSNDNKLSSNLLYFNPDLSNADNIIANGIYKIWFPGRYKMIWNG